MGNQALDEKIMRTLVSQGVIPYIKLLIEEMEEEKRGRDATIAEIGEAVKTYDIFCCTGRA